MVITKRQVIEVTKQELFLKIYQTILGWRKVRPTEIILIPESIFVFVTLSVAKGLDSSIATLPQNDKYKNYLGNYYNYSRAAG